MRVAAIYDIHGNLPALEAVLHDARSEGVTHVVVGGDAVLGPMPRETLDCLLDLDIPIQFIEGNCDRYVLAEMRGTPTDPLPEQIRENIRWVAQQLDREHERVLASWPATVSVEIRELGEVLFCHATPRNDIEIFGSFTPEGRLLPVFQGVNASLVVCGHTHMQFDRVIGSVRVLNAGSVGMPFGAPGADWLLLGPDVELRHTGYDVANAADRIRRTKYPQAEDFAARNVLQPPTQETMLAAFAKAELR
jgi:predicted phosphodiesterase